MTTGAVILDESYRQVEFLLAEPRCGIDYCDACGDCLSCYLGDPCYESRTGEHPWYVYADAVEEWRLNHPEAKPIEEVSDAPVA